jgi:putative ABC transport system permease protein
VSLVRTVVGDALFGLRTYARRPGFTAAAVLALALGIAVNTAMFSVVYATLLAPLPYPEPEQLVTVWPSSGPGKRSIFTASDFLALKRETRSFAELHAWSGRQVSFGVGEGAEATDALLATPGYLAMLGSGLALGRDFLPEEGTVGRDRVVILSHRTWRQRFGGDPTVLGRTVRIDREPYAVVGVQASAPPTYDWQPSLLLPLAFTDEQLASPYYFFALSSGRLAPGVTIEQATAEASAVWKQVTATRPSPSGGGIEVAALKTSYLSDGRVRALWLLMAAVACVLLIACANVANLLLARGALRRREIALRTSLGASRGRIFGQLLAESAGLSVIGGLLGVALAFGFLRLMEVMAADIATPGDLLVSLPVLAFTVTATVASTLVFGSAPAWQAMRIDPIEGLKDGGYATLGVQRSFGRRALVAAEIALALTLLAGGGLVVRDLASLSRVDLGLRPERLLTFRVGDPEGAGADGEHLEAFYRRVTDGLRALPGVETVGLSTWLPLQGAMFSRSFDVVGHPDPAARRGASFNMVTPNYFAAYGIELRRGRSLSAADRAGTPRVAVVNETFVRRFLEGLDPLRQRLTISHVQPGLGGTKGPANFDWDIVGVYCDTRHGGPKGETQPAIDVPFAQNPWPDAWIAVRTRVEPQALRSSIDAVLGGVAPDLVAQDVRTMEQRIERTLATERFNAALFGSFGILALVLAALGVYAVTSFSVAQRTREIGLRMALGADRRRVLWSVVREGMATVLGGTAVGVFGAYAAIRSMRSLVHAVQPTDPVPLAAVAGLLLAAALVACVVPARRAARVDPLVALRED